MNNSRIPWLRTAGDIHVIQPMPKRHRLLGATLWAWAYRAVKDIALVSALFGEEEVFFEPSVSLWHQEGNKASGYVLLMAEKDDVDTDDVLPCCCVCYGTWDAKGLKNVDSETVDIDAIFRCGSMIMVFHGHNKSREILDLLPRMYNTIGNGVSLVEEQHTIGSGLFDLNTCINGLGWCLQPAGGMRAPSLEQLLDNFRQLVVSLCQDAVMSPVSAPCVSYRCSVWEALRVY